MERFRIAARKNWQSKLEDIGMNYHTIENKVYWNESAYYQLSSDLVDKIDDATLELHEMCIKYCTKTIQSGNYDGYDFSDYTISLIEQSWKNYHPSLYGRFDLGISKTGDIKMFEYNADTPTSLLEASVAQWNWKEEVFLSLDQFNSIHEKLIEQWKCIKSISNKLHFAGNKDAPYEDWGNIHYLMETAIEAGFNGTSIDIESVGYDKVKQQFVDLNDEEIKVLFKLYPWEWFSQDEFYHYIDKSRTMFIEPPWKMLLSNKLLCVKLWEMFPNNKYLLPAYTTDYAVMHHYHDIPGDKWLRKPLLGREGQGIVSLDFTTDKNSIVQQKLDVVEFNGIQPVIGSWIIGDIPAGIGIREDKGITTNNSCFVPHVFR